MRNNPKYRLTAKTEPVNSEMLKAIEFPAIDQFKDAKHNQTRLTIVFSAENVPTIFDYYLN